MKKYLIPLIAAGALFSAQAALADGEALFKSKPCVACHAMETKMVGPSLKDVAERYENNEESVATWPIISRTVFPASGARSRCRLTRSPTKKPPSWPSGFSA